MFNETEGIVEEDELAKLVPDKETRDFCWKLLCQYQLCWQLDSSIVMPNQEDKKLYLFPSLLPLSTQGTS